MNVCMVAYTHYEADNRVMRYAETLAARGDRVDVIALRHPNEQPYSNVHGVNVFRVQSRIRNERVKGAYLLRILSFLFRSAWLLARRNRQLHYDLIHVHSVPDFLVFAAWYPKMTGAKVILDIHDILPEFYASKFGASKQSITFKLLLLVEKLSAKIADHVIIANDLWRDRIVARSVGKAKCSTVLNCPDRRIFCRTSRTRQDDRFVILYPGSLGRHQGLDVAIRAFAKVCNRVPFVDFHIYGDGGEKPRLIDLARELRLENRLFIHNSVSLREIAAVISNADLGVVPKRSDGFGNEAFSTKILEFMTIGVPLIISETKIDRYYFDNSLVRFVPSGDEDALAHAMIELVNNPDLREQFVRNGLECSNRYDWDVNKSAYLGLVDLLTSRGSGVDVKTELNRCV